MKLYSLNNKRLIKSIILKLNNIKLLLLIGATILTFGGFFYSQITLAKTLPTTISSHNKIFAKKTPLQKLTAEPTTELKNTQSQKPVTTKLSYFTKDLDISSLSLKNKREQQNIILKKNITEILIGTPMETMIEPISKQNKTVAAFLVGIALKESGLGRHAPTLNGKDCFNYWGYREKRTRMGTGGHTCFDNPEDAVNTVAKRINTLAIEQKRNTPKKMLIWKCGSDCGSAGGWPAAYKWVSDVSIYFNKINNS